MNITYWRISGKDHWEANILTRFEKLERENKNWKRPELKMEYIHVDIPAGHI